MTEYLTAKQRVASTIGHIVIASQDLERQLRVLGAFAGKGDWIEKNEKFQQLSKKTLGKNVANLVKHAEGNVEEFSRYIYSVVQKRNNVVHHYFDTFLSEIAAEDYEAIADALESQLQEIQNVTGAFHKSIESLAGAIAELDGSTS